MMEAVLVLATIAQGCRLTLVPGQRGAMARSCRRFPGIIATGINGFANGHGGFGQHGGFAGHGGRGGGHR